MKKHGQCYFLTYVRPPKKFGHIFSNFWPIFRHLPPLFEALSWKFSCETFQNYQISMYNSNTDSLGLILGVEFFFLWVTVQEHCVLYCANDVTPNIVFCEVDYINSLHIAAVVRTSACSTTSGGWWPPWSSTAAPCLSCSASRPS